MNDRTKSSSDNLSLSSRQIPFHLVNMLRRISLSICFKENNVAISGLQGSLRAYIFTISLCSHGSVLLLAMTLLIAPFLLVVIDCWVRYSLSLNSLLRASMNLRKSCPLFRSPRLLISIGAGSLSEVFPPLLVSYLICFLLRRLFLIISSSFCLSIFVHSIIKFSFLRLSW